MHPKHYTLVYRLLNKLRDNKIHIDIYGIFSDTDDYGAFDMKSRIKHIIPEGVPSDDSAVEYKRLYGLKQMMNTKYENIISAVSEIDIIPENFTKANITQKVNDIFRNKKLYGADTGKFKDIMNSCAGVFEGEDYAKVKSATKGLTLYTYFYNIPVYKREHIQGFLDAIHYDTLKLTWHNFDNLMYEYYLIVAHNFKVVDITPYVHDNGHGMYVNTIKDLEELKKLGFGFGNVGKMFWKKMSTRLKEEKTFLLINTDRSG